MAKIKKHPIWDHKDHRKKNFIYLTFRKCYNSDMKENSNFLTKQIWRIFYMKGKKPKRFSILIAAVFLIVTAAQPVFAFGLSEAEAADPAQGSGAETKYSQDRIIVTFKDDVSKKEAADILKEEEMESLFSCSARGGGKHYLG